jgi:hypothetical protein
MNRSILGAFFLALLGSEQARAIEDVPTSSYNESAPTAAGIPSWTSGWQQPATQPNGYTYTTGWNYVGTVKGSGSTASGVYLGNGWVLTAAHVGAGLFTLNGTTYSMVANSAQNIGSVDIVLFRVSPCPSLPALPLASSDPTAYKTQVAMIGFGDGYQMTNETWGFNTVTEINQSMTPEYTSWVSNDFLTITGQSSNGKTSATNSYQVVSGDSGGGDFTYNSSAGRWELAGINEVTGTVTYSNGSTQGYSGFVQLDTYATQIEQITAPVVDTPVMPPWALIILGGAVLGLARPGLAQGKP